MCLAIATRGVCLIGGALHASDVDLLRMRSKPARVISAIENQIHDSHMMGIAQHSYYYYY